MRCAAIVSDGVGSLDAPLILHALITGACNGSCRGCRYRRASGELDRSVDWWIERIREFADLGGKTLALGGGEPTLVKRLPDIVAAAKEAGLFVSMTTNGVVPRRIEGLDLVHISCDSRHPVNWVSAPHVIDFYEAFVPTVGWNVVLWSPDDLASAALYSPCTLIMPKPWWTHEPDVQVLEQLLHFGASADSCLATWLNQEGHVSFRTPCLQGRVSMCIDDLGRASICSHVPEHLRVQAGTVAEMWDGIRLREGEWEQKTLADCLESWRDSDA